MVAESEYCIAVPPGETIKEQLEERNMSMEEFIRSMGESEKFIAELLEGDVALTESVAAKLESVLGIPSQFWNNLEGIYRADLKKCKR
jgi:HTH-type transcriptional regulator / antitoxin HigA